MGDASLGMGFADIFRGLARAQEAGPNSIPGLLPKSSVESIALPVLLAVSALLAT
jgi:hypothetical protein